MNKICTQCELSKDIAEFYVRDKNKGTYQSWCKLCKNEHDRFDYRECNVERRVALAEARERARKKSSEFIWDYLLEHPCVDCGESNIVLLQFDHLRDKAHNVAALAGGYAIERIKKEIAKCEVVCANCHIIRTATRGGWKIIAYQDRQTGKAAGF